MTKNEYKKKILILGLILIAVSSTLTAISAESSFTNIEQSKTLVNNQLTINDIHFTIPDGYEEIENDTDITATEIDDDGETETETEDIDGTLRWKFREPQPLKVATQSGNHFCHASIVIRYSVLFKEPIPGTLNS